MPAGDDERRRAPVQRRQVLDEPGHVDQVGAGGAVENTLHLCTHPVVLAPGDHQAVWVAALGKSRDSSHRLGVPLVGSPRAHVQHVRPIRVPTIVVGPVPRLDAVGDHVHPGRIEAEGSHGLIRRVLRRRHHSGRSEQARPVSAPPLALDVELGVVEGERDEIMHRLHPRDR